MLNALITIGFMLSMFFFSSKAYGFVDQWLNQHTSVSPNYMEGQNRGYFNAGSFSARWHNSNDYLFTAMPPKVKGGCGGIDIFMGGFSFLNAEYLTAKLQKIMSAAPAAAFDIALKTLCEPCSNTIKSLEALANSLNSLQLDDCKASRVVAAYLMDPLAKDGAKKQDELDKIQKDFLLSTGIKELSKGIDDLVKSVKGNPLPETKFTDMIAGCPQDIKDVLGKNGYVLDNISAKLGINVPGFTNLVRGVIGDVYFSISNNHLVVNYISSCEENKQITLDSFKNGKLYSKPTSGVCTPVPDANKDLVKYVQTKMQKIATAIRNKSLLASDDTAFIQKSPLAIGLVLKTAVGTQTEASIIAQLSDITATAYAAAMVEDMFNKTIFIFDKVKEITTKQSTATTDKEPHTCKISELGVAEKIPAMQTKAIEFIKVLKQFQSAQAAEINNILQYVKRIEEFNTQAAVKIAEKFGSGVAKRALGK